jgi:hypothetical protein
MFNKRDFKTVYLFILLVLVIYSLPLRAEKAEEVINPRRVSGSFVTDGGGVLGPEYIRLIDDVCR